MKIVEEKGINPHIYNQPTTDEIAAILPSSNETLAGRDRDIVVRGRTTDSDPHPLQRIPHHSPLYHPLHYILLFPRGEEGYKLDLTSVSSRSVTKTRTAQGALEPIPEIPDDTAAPLKKRRIDRRREDLNTPAVFTLLDFLKYRLHERSNEFPILFLSQR